MQTWGQESSRNRHGGKQGINDVTVMDSNSEEAIVHVVKPGQHGRSPNSGKASDIVVSNEFKVEVSQGNSQRRESFDQHFGPTFYKH